jgi:hypothetical protein
VALARDVARMDGWRDHGLFYYAPRLFLQGRDAYDWDALKAEWRRDGKPLGIDPGTTMSGFVTPPSMALLTLLPALAPPSSGYRAIDLWNLVGLGACLIFLVGVGGRGWPAEARILFAAFVLSLPDVAGVVLLGQSTLLICACLCASVVLFSRSPDSVPGSAAIGLALAKFTLSLPFLALLAYRRKGRALAVALIVFLGINVAVSAPRGVLRTFKTFRAVLSRENRPGTSYDAISSNPTYMPDTLIHGKRLLYLIFGNRRSLVEGLNVGLSLIAVAVMAVVLRPRRGSRAVIHEPLEIALLTVSGLLLFYHRTYDLAALILVGYALVDEGFRGRDHRTAAWGAMVAIFAVVTRSATLVYGLGRWLSSGTNLSSMLCWINCLLLTALFVLCAFRLNQLRSRNGSEDNAESAPATH